MLEISKEAFVGKGNKYVEILKAFNRVQNYLMKNLND